MTRLYNLSLLLAYLKPEDMRAALSREVLLCCAWDPELHAPSKGGMAQQQEVQFFIQGAQVPLGLA
jgi:hypothetical protein